MTVTNTAGLSTVCDPVWPATKKARAPHHPLIVKPALSGFMLATNLSHVIYGATPGVTLTGAIAGAAGQTVKLMSQSCKATGASRLATIRDLLTVTSSAILAANVYGATLRAVLPASGCYAGAASGLIKG